MMKKNKYWMIILINICIIWITGITVYSQSSTAYKSISTLGNDLLFINNDNALWLYNDDLGESVKVSDNVKSTYGNTYIDEKNNLWEIHSDNYNNITNALIAHNVIKYCHSYLNEYIVKTDGSLWVKGYNYYGLSDIMQWEHSDIYVKLMDNVCDIAAGYAHTIALMDDGTAIVWGNNYYGQLGTGTRSEKTDTVNIFRNIRYINAGTNSTYMIEKDDNLLFMGRIYGNYMVSNETDVLSAAVYTDKAKKSVSRAGFTMVLKSNGEVWLYGETSDASTAYIVTDEAYELKEYSGLPQKLMDNISDISEINSDQGQAVLLNNTGELFEFAFVENNNTVGCSLKKIAENVQVQTKEFSFNENAYTDISPKSTAIMSLTRAGIFNGVSDTEFMPDKAISRAETAALLLRMTGKGDENAQCDFSDVSPSDWYYGIAGASGKYGIFDGYEDNTFRGDETVSELQLAVLAARALRNEENAPNIELKPVPELSNIPEWAKEDIIYAYQYGIVTDEELKTLSAKGMTRGVAAVMLYRLYHVV